MVEHTVYILRSEKDGKRYIGLTSNLERRLTEHNSGKVKSTRNRKPMQLIYREEFASRSEARQREQFFKTGKGREYLKSHNL